jgi:hypothetical protein
MMGAMCCLVLAVLMVGPRLGLILLFLFTNAIGRAFHHGMILPLAGFVFLPWTTLAYTWLASEGHPIEGVYLVILIVAVVVDLGAHGGGARHRWQQGRPR